jgi:hypothetical protein
VSSIPTFSTESFLNSVSALDADSVWAVGSYYDTQNSTYRTLTMHWNGTQWTTVSSPALGNNSILHSVRFTREGDVWAVGEYKVPNTLAPKAAILHWNDNSWELASNPKPGVTSSLFGAATIAGNGVITGTWVVGSYAPRANTPYQTLVELVKSPPPPPHTTSYYETSVSASKHYDQGCAAFQSYQDGIIVLHYGSPRDWSGIGQEFGTLLLGSGDKVQISHPSEPDITEAVKSFVSGYAACSQYGTSNGHTITVTIGLNNDSMGESSALTWDHGAAWANMVKEVDTYIVANNWHGFIAVASAIDIHPSWTDYEPVEEWIQGYHDQNAPVCYNVGTTDGYPNESSLPVPPPWDLSDWSTEQLYNVSRGIAGQRPFPSIFGPQMSRNWHRVKSWSVETDNLLVEFAGELSGYIPCSAVGGATSCFDPGQAWQRFFYELNSDPRAPIRQRLDYSSEIKCSNDSTSVGCQ